MCDARDADYTPRNDWIKNRLLPARKPEEKLADLMTADLGVTIDARKLRLFILARWDRVCKHAHAVHDAD